MKIYEVEIKSLLGSKEAAEQLKSNLKERFPNLKLASHGKQLNHYFNTPADPAKLAQKIGGIIPADKKSSFENILTHGQKMSVRTRDADGHVSFIIKTSVGDDTSANGVKRIEFEVPVGKSLQELDQALIEAGCSYQAKWSREREEYSAGNINVCIDKNAGYGYLAEFEKMVSAEGELEGARQELLGVMNVLGVHELFQDRLERMFSYYNTNWPDYYGTDKTFTVQ